MLLSAVNVSSVSAVSGNALQQQLQRWRLEPQQAQHSVSNVSAAQPFLFIGVLSVPKSLERRHAVRQTWMQDAGPDVTVRFVLYEVGWVYQTKHTCCQYCILHPSQNAEHAVQPGRMKSMTIAIGMRPWPRVGHILSHGGRKCTALHC